MSNHIHTDIQLSLPYVVFEKVASDLRRLATPFIEPALRELYEDFAEGFETLLSENEGQDMVTLETDNNTMDPLIEALSVLLHKGEDGMPIQGLFALKAFFYEFDRILQKPEMEQFYRELGSDDLGVAELAYNILYKAPWER